MSTFSLLSQSCSCYLSQNIIALFLAVLQRQICHSRLKAKCMFGYGCSVAGTPSCGGVSRDAGDVLQLQTSGDRSGDGDYDDEEEHGRHEVIFGQTNVREDKEKV